MHVLSRARALAAGAVVLLGTTALPVLVTATTADAAGPVTIGVDHRPPGSHNFSYLDFFPSASVKVHQGDVVQFQWAKVPDGFHDVAILKQGLTPGDAWSTAYPLVAADLDDPMGPHGPQLQLNPKILAGNSFGCGTSAAPCSYTGAADVLSQPMGTDGKASFVAKIDAAPGTVVQFVCLIHPSMQGQLTVVAPTAKASSAGSAFWAATKQWTSLTASALRAEARVKATYTRNPDGTRTIQGTAGLNVTTKAGVVEIEEMLPRVIKAKPGDQITWSYKAGAEIHTVTFPRDATQGEPLPLVCEGDPNPDTAASTTGPPCADLTKIENHIVPAPQGTNVITTAATFGSSGIISAPGGPLPSSYTFSFPSKGSFSYFCHIHDHMTGVVKVTGH